jgi:hypothetical protein
VEVDKGGRDVLADRTGIMLGGGMTARVGRGLTPFGTSASPIASWDAAIATGFIASLIAGCDSDVVAGGFARGVLKLNGIGTVGIMRAIPGVVDLSSAVGRCGVLSREIDDRARCGDATVVLIAAVTGRDTENIETSSWMVERTGVVGWFVCCSARFADRCST